MTLVQIWLCWASGMPMITFVDPLRKNVAWPAPISHIAQHKESTESTKSVSIATW